MVDTAERARSLVDRYWEQLLELEVREQPDLEQPRTTRRNGAFLDVAGDRLSDSGTDPPAADGARDAPTRRVARPVGRCLRHRPPPPGLRRRRIRGKALTPFLLGAVVAATEGRGLRANQALLIQNARVAGEIAVALHSVYQNK